MRSFTSHRKRNRGLAVVAALAGVSLLSACGASDAGGGSDADGGGVLVAAQPVDIEPGSFLKTTYGNILTEYAVFETLTMVSPETGEPEGVLAESWTIADDQMSMDLVLRDDVTFHSGKQFTADDVIFTLETVADPADGAANQVLAAGISEIEKVSDAEIHLEFAAPTIGMFDLFETMPIVNADTYADNAAGEVVDGTGRFVWDTWTPGSSLELTKYEDYRDVDTTELDGIEIQVISDPSALLSAVRSGAVNYAIGVTSTDATVLAEDPGFELVKTAARTITMGMDVTMPPFDQKEVRQAVAYAIDRERINEQVYGGESRATDLFWNENSLGYDEDQATHYTYDPEKAAELISAAGAEGASFELITVNDPSQVGTFEVVQNDLAAVGLNVTIRAVDSAEFDELKAAGDFGTAAFFLGSSETQSPAVLLQTRPELRPVGNLAKFESPEYSALVEAVVTATDTDATRESLYAYNEYLLDETFLTTIISSGNISVRSADVDGIKGTQVGFVRLDEAYFTS